MAAGASGVIQVVEGDPTPQSDPFRKMAENIDHAHYQTNAMPYAGAAVIVPPQDGGDPVEVLLLDRKADPAQFWATVLTRVQMRINEIQEVQSRASQVRKY